MRWAWFVIVVALGVWPLAANAAPDPAKERARAAVARAKSAYSTDNYLEAARAYLEAHQALVDGGHPPKPGLLFNAALAYEKAGACDQTVELFTAFLKARPKAASSEISERLAEARRCAPEVAISSRPAGAQIVIDGRLRGVAPATVPVASGRHTLRLKLDGYQEVEKTFQVARGRPTAVALALEPVPSTGFVMLKVPSGFTVALAGGAPRPGPIEEQLSLPPGTHQLQFQREGCLAEVRSVQIAAGTTTPVQASATCLPLPKAKTPAAVGVVVEAEAKAIPALTWGAGGVAVAALSAGIVLSVLHLGAANDRDTLNADPSSDGAAIRALDDKAFNLSLGSGAAYGVAGGAAVTALLAWLLTSGEGT